MKEKKTGDQSAKADCAANSEGLSQAEWLRVIIGGRSEKLRLLRLALVRQRELRAEVRLSVLFRVFAAFADLGLKRRAYAVLDEMESIDLGPGFDLSLLIAEVIETRLADSSLAIIYLDRAQRFIESDSDTGRRYHNAVKECCLRIRALARNNENEEDILTVARKLNSLLDWATHDSDSLAAIVEIVRRIGVFDRSFAPIVKCIWCEQTFHTCFVAQSPKGGTLDMKSLLKAANLE